MTVRSTSIAAYRDLRDAGRLNTQRARIIAIVARRNDASLREIQQAYQRTHGVLLDVGTVSARVKALKDDEILREAPPRKCRVTERTINPVQVNPAQVEESA